MSLTSKGTEIWPESQKLWWAAVSATRVTGRAFNFNIDAQINKVGMASARADQRILWFDRVPEFVHRSGWLGHKA